MVQLSTCEPTAPVIEQALAVWDWIDQFTPDPAGRGSLMATPVAVPWPEFVTPTVNPICEPAFTVVASAVLVAPRFGQVTVVVAWGVKVVKLVPEMVAVLGYG